jgi:hypothetical protein
MDVVRQEVQPFFEAALVQHLRFDIEEALDVALEEELVQLVLLGRVDVCLLLSSAGL